MRYGFIKSQVDLTMFYKHSREGKSGILIVHVDDILLVSSYLMR